MSISEQHEKLTAATLAHIKKLIPETPVDDYHEIRARRDRREALTVFFVELGFAAAVIGAIYWAMTR